MCGIAGIYRFDGRPISPARLRRMTDTLRHRGPDDEGCHVDGAVGLGHRRLSIIDLSPRGRQPMSNEDGSVWVTYNGEIYNFVELKAELIRRGHQFRSDTDTEVIVHLYEEEGVDCLKRLNGMFAFALWDSRRQRLLLARDRLGIKPLFYAVNRDKLLFGSEIKAILAGSDDGRRIDVEALHHFLSFNYMAAPLTMFEGIRQLLPGQYLLLEDGRVSLGEYWDLRFQEDGNRAHEAEYRERVEQLLRRIVERMVVSDVPFGAFLSGGIDSSTVTYFMSHILPHPVKTFSIGFKEATYSELEYARLAAARSQTDHHEEIVTAEKLDELLPTLVWHGEEPTADASMVPLYYLSRLARRHVTMVLSGDGSDEIFAGYETYSAYYAARLYRAIPPLIRRTVLAAAVARLPMSDAKLSFSFKARRFVRGAEMPADVGHSYWRLILDEQAKREIYSQELAERVAGLDTFEETYARYFARTNARTPLNRMLYVDTRFYLPNDMLVKVDRMSMAQSLEVRVPFLDHELVELLATVPPSLKLRHFTNKKYLLKRVMAGKLPRRVLSRAKQGFNIPVGKWIREPLRDFVQDVLSERSVRDVGLFKPRAVRQLLSDHFERRADNGYQIWGLMVFFLWWHAFVEARPAAVTSAQ